MNLTENLHQAHRKYWSDRTAARQTLQKANANTNHIDLGLAILSAITPPGVVRTQHEIAAYCGCTVGNIYWIERRAIHKLKKQLFMHGNHELRELVEAITGRAMA